MGIRIVLFLAFVSINIITNTVILFFAYKAFAGAVSKMSQTASEFQKSSETRKWVESVRAASERTAVLTESTKVKVAESAAVFSRAQENYRRTLVSIDSRLRDIEQDVNIAAETAKNIVAEPVASASSFAAGIMKVLGNLGKDNSGSDF
jgi:hypothetical protein